MTLHNGRRLFTAASLVGLALPTLPACSTNDDCRAYATPSAAALAEGHLAGTARIVEVGEGKLVLSTDGGTNYTPADFVARTIELQLNDCSPQDLQEGEWVAYITDKNGGVEKLVEGTPGVVPISSSTSPIPEEWPS